MFRQFIKLLLVVMLNVLLRKPSTPLSRILLIFSPYRKRASTQLAPNRDLLGQQEIFRLEISGRIAGIYKLNSFREHSCHPPSTPR
ncbi:uncharacterized protein B0T23DRAFT_213860 [Neurospora hispaniola]|uniref:Secreted protein n=1 Tax=Neurospora hispaniola TaxID=588809 RepID=A0AAJ0I1R7_9PEZI|nr:hypothetical protein B0T23DRAFT_213860 [Neurospora hispaniola]